MTASRTKCSTSVPRRSPGRTSRLLKRRSAGELPTSRASCTPRSIASMSAGSAISFASMSTGSDGPARPRCRSRRRPGTGGATLAKKQLVFRWCGPISRVLVTMKRGHRERSWARSFRLDIQPLARQGPRHVRRAGNARASPGPSQRIATSGGVASRPRYTPGMADAPATRPDTGPDRSAPRKTVPYLELALECGRPQAGPARYRLSALERVRLGRGAERDVRLADDGCLDILVPDAWVSSSPAELARGPLG